MEKNHINQTKLNFGGGAGNAAVNLFTGGMTFEHPDVSIGANSYQIGISHIYMSNPEPQLLSALNQCCGMGWKLNIQQYLIKSGSTYSYYDANANCYEFELYDSSEQRFYDKSGSGLVLFVKVSNGNTERYIEDPQKNKMYFDNAGRLGEIFLYANKSSKKILYNSSGFPLKIYDTKKPSKYIEFIYSGNLLIKTVCKNNAAEKLVIQYTYNSENLTGIKEYADGTERYNSLFTYDNNGKLNYAVRVNSRSAVKIEYLDNNVFKIATGSIAVTPVLSPKQNVVFGSNSTFCGDDFCGESDQTLSGYNISTNSFAALTSAKIEYEYSNGRKISAIVDNNRKNIIEYFFNKAGLTTAVFKRHNGTKYNLKTLTKDGGTCILRHNDFYYKNDVEQKAGGIDSVNSKPSVKIPCNNSNKIELKYSLISRDYENCGGLEEFWKEQTKTEFKNNNHVLSFWLKYSGGSPSYLKTKMTYTDGAGGYDFTKQAYVDHTAVDVWQYVTIPFKLEHSLSWLKFEFLSDTSGEVQISNLRVSLGTPSKAYISRNADRSEMSSLWSCYPLSEIYQVVLGIKNQSAPSTLAINKDFFVTDSDIFETLKNEHGLSGSYDFIHNGGTKRIANVTSIQLCPSFTNSVPMTKTNGLSNVFLRTDSPDDKSHTYTFFEYLDNVDYGFYIKQTVSTKSNGATEQTNIFNSTGYLLEKTDAYGVQTKYVLDRGYNLTKVIVKNTSGGETLTYENLYDETDQQERELPSGQKQNNITTNYTFNDPFCTINTMQTGSQYTTKCEYDTFNRPKTVMALDGTQAKARNEIRYDDFGRIRFLSDCDTFSYSFAYDKFGMPTKYSMIKQNGQLAEEKIMMEKSRVDDGDYNICKEKIYDGNGSGAETETGVDWYGRIDYVLENGAPSIWYRYQENDESDSVAAIERIIDKNDGTAEYTYNYDSDNRPTGYVLSGGSAPLTVRQTAHNKTRYSFDGKDTETEIVYDENVGVEPRISETVYKEKNTSDKDIEKNWDNVTEVKKKYYYDSLGRLSSTRVFGSRFRDERFVYKPSTNFIEQKTHKSYDTIFPEDFPIFGDAGGNSFFTFDYEYDNSGNMTKATETEGTTKETIVTVLKTNSESYTYDILNRVDTEKNTKLDIEYKYHYNSRGQLQKINKISNNATVKSFTYDDFGRMQSSPLGSCTQNNYGSFTSIGSNTLNWTGRKLSSYTTSMGTNTYSYNFQGVRFKKVLSNGITKTYFNDGSKLLGENWSDGTKLRYFYDASGIIGFSHNGKQYDYVKDALGNIKYIRELLTIGTTILSYITSAEYCYDAWGNTTIKGDTGIGAINPFRWKSYYYDTESDFYYIDGRYYSPALYSYVSAADPESLLSNAATIFGLNRYLISTNNAIAFIAAIYTIFTSSQLYTDPDYNPDFDWRILVKNILSLALLIFSIISFMIDPIGSIISMAILAGFAITGAVIGGLVSVAKGNSFAEGATKGAVIGYIVGTVALIAYGIASKVIAANKVNPATVADDVAAAKPADVVKAQADVVQPQCFKEGTIVKTKDGDKKIEEVEVGDEVLAYDEETGIQEFKKVVQLFRNEASRKTSVKIKADDGKIDEIVSTPGHKYYLPDNNENRNPGERLEHASYEGLSEVWVSACNLKKGDRVLLANADALTGKPKYGIVIGVKTEDCEAYTTYNFEVADFHTYYVGENGVCVHNRQCGLIDDVVPDGYEPTFKNGEYQHNPKHGMAQHGRSSAKLSSQQYGQYALDNAIPSPHGGKALYAYNGKNLIQFYPSNGYYHGYYTNLAGINGKSARNFLLHYFDL